jgi:PRC-barrel domain
VASSTLAKGNFTMAHHSPLRIALAASALTLGLTTIALAQTAPAAPAISQPTAAAMEKFYTGPMQATTWRSSDVMDQPVLNLQRERIGEVSDLIIDGEGRVVAAVVGVGGFLGMGEHDVALSYRAIKMTRDEKGKALLSADVTKETLKSAPKFKAVKSAKAN